MKHTKSLLPPGLRAALCRLMPAVARCWLSCGVILAGLFGAAYADQDPPTVLATIKPLHSLASVVTEGVGDARLMIDSNTSPHTFQMKPSHVRAVREADIIVWAGEGVERFLPSMIRNFNPDVPALAMVDMEGAVTHTSRAGHADLSHGHDSIDYHLWLDPDNAVLLVDVLAAELASLDVNNADRYLANAKSFRQQLESTVAQVDELLDGVEAARYVVYHDSLQYFEKAFGAGKALVVAPQPQVQAGARRLRELYREVAKTEPRCLIAEPQFRSPAIRVLSEELDLQPVTVDPLAFEFAAGSDLYLQWLLHTAKTLAVCLGDSGSK